MVDILTKESLKISHLLYPRRIGLTGHNYRKVPNFHQPPQTESHRPSQSPHLRGPIRTRRAPVVRSASQPSARALGALRDILRGNQPPGDMQGSVTPSCTWTQSSEDDTFDVLATVGDIEWAFSAPVIPVTTADGEIMIDPTSGAIATVLGSAIAILATMLF